MVAAKYGMSGKCAVSRDYRSRTVVVITVSGDNGFPKNLEKIYGPLTRRVSRRTLSDIARQNNNNNKKK